MELLIIVGTSIILLIVVSYLYYYVTHLEKSTPKKSNRETPYSSLKDNQRINDKFSLFSFFTGLHQDDNDYEPFFTRMMKFFFGHGRR